MADECLTLSSEYQKHLLTRYGERRPKTLSYGTVRDFCDSADVIPILSNLQGDLKDYQRPAALKGLLGLVPSGARLLEIGAGDPYVAHMLQQMGYDVTIIDPYDGSGRGPTEFEYYQRNYPNLRFVRSFFSANVDAFEPGSFDCIYSISVLEHVPSTNLVGLFQGIRDYVRSGGFSFHLIDYVLAGMNSDFHLSHLSQIAVQQGLLSGRPPEVTVGNLLNTITQAAADLDTYFLSAEGHNRWRGNLPYDEFPYRKVISVNSCEAVATFECEVSRVTTA